MSPLLSELNLSDLNFEASGSFLQDYPEYCKKRNVKPMHLHVIKGGARQTSENDSGPINMYNNANSKDLINSQSRPGTVSGNLTSANVNNAVSNASEVLESSDSNSKPSSASAKRFGPLSPTETARGNGQPYPGVQFRTPTIQLEYLEDPDNSEDILAKISIRGWTLLPGTIEGISACLPASMTLSSICLWNCGIDDASFSMLINCLMHCNVLSFQSDQNPVNETLFSGLLSDLSPIKYLTLRSNNISDSGFESIASSLRTNRTLVSLNLYHNNISDKGMEYLAEALKYNQTLISLSLGRNNIRDDGIKALVKVFTKFPVTPDEIASRKKYFIEMDKRKKELEEDQMKRVGKGGPKSNSANRPGSSLNKKEDQRRTSQTDIQKASNSPTKKGAAANPPAKPPAPTAKKPGNTTSVSSSQNAPGGNAQNDPVSNAKKGEIRKGSSEAKGKEKENAKKNANAPVKGGKKKGEETKDEVDEIDSAIADITFESNGVSYLLGNRTLNNMNFYMNGISEAGVQAIYDAVLEQDVPEGNQHVGLIRINLLGNNFDRISSQIYNSLAELLKARNPFTEELSSEKPDQANLNENDNDDNGD